MSKASRPPLTDVSKSASSWFVDEECIACDACVLIAEKHFKIDESGEKADVIRQPQTLKETALCQEAMEACPVEAIHSPSGGK